MQYFLKFYEMYAPACKGLILWQTWSVLVVSLALCWITILYVGAFQSMMHKPCGTNLFPQLSF